MMIELPINQSAQIRVFRQIRVRTDLHKRQAPTYQNSYKKRFQTDSV